MRVLRALALAGLVTSVCTLAACGPVEGGPVDSGPGDGPDAGPVGETPDAGPGGGHAPLDCDNPPIEPAATGGCTFAAGTTNVLLLRGNLLTTDRELRNGHVLVGADGRITCAGCDCSAAEGFDGARIIACADGVISPGLINTHDHITYTGLAPHAPSTERYEHRHHWRKGTGGHTKIPSPSTPRAVSWGELRMVLGGATSLVGSGGAEGLVRNLDENAAKQEGLGKKPVANQTFPLGDSDGTLLTSTCAYGSLDSPTEAGIAAADAYAPHVAEGVGPEARNEFLCLSGKQEGGTDLVMPKSAFIHGIGLLPQDYAAMAAEGTALIWSPRSNVDLYGLTASVTIAARLGVQLALGTDWTASGSMNVLRELRCADGLNRDHYGNFFTDRELVLMTTANAAAVTATSDVLGSLDAGKWADIAIFGGAGRANGWRAVIDADAKDVLLVLRGGKVLFGETPLVDGLGATGCEPLDVCGGDRTVCVERETGKTLAALQIHAGTPYGLFFCDVPPNEPTCVPTRPGEFTGQSRADDQDGDGIANDADNCPTVFNPVRLVDGTAQGDVDADGAGDACDVCPTTANATDCLPPDPDDSDLDGVKDADDNCPALANDQVDRDRDGKGDACDACPESPNPGAAACTVSLYDVKEGRVSGQVRIANALVTVAASTGFFAQLVPGDDGFLTADWSGLFVYMGSAAKPAVGTRVDVTGTVGAYFGQVQLTDATFTVTGDASETVEPVVVLPETVATGGARAQSLESVLVRVENVSVTDLAPAPGAGDRAPTFEFAVTGGLRVNDFLYVATPPIQLHEPLAHVQGVLRLANENTKIEPRGEADLGRRPYLVGFPEPTVSVALDADPLPTVELRMSAPVAADVVIGLASSNEAVVTVPATVTVPAGEQAVLVTLTPVAASAAPVTITATAEGDSRTTEVLVHDPAAVRTLSSVTLAPAAAQVGDALVLTISLDAPAGATPPTVTIGVAPDGVMTLESAEVVFTAGQQVATVAGTATALGEATVTVTLGEQSLTATLVVEPPPSERLPAPGELLVTEIMANPGTVEPGSEWVELYNASNATLLLDGVSFNDNPATNQKTLSGTGLTLAPGAYVVFAYSTAGAAAVGVTAAWEYGPAGGTGGIQLANGGDFVAISVAGVEIDKAAYTATFNGVSLCRQRVADDGAYTTTWGGSFHPWATGDKGSPGAANTADNCR